MRLTLLVWLICIGVSSCGFQLRGSGSFESALSTLQITAGNRYGDLHQNLERGFTQSGVSVVGASVSADYILAIEAEEYSRRPVSTTSTISVAEYELRLEVDITLVNALGEPVIPSTAVVTERIFTFNNSSLVGSNEEQATLLEEMRSDLVLQIVRRVDASVRSFEASR
ncbi:MAG: hypothetical protein CMQ20_15465 [Gammaproteobacteria bacterium]|jgi:LPS-assembly lipoprotein|nr:hypothetical protein [Gammaproteobacteria bacterium]